MDWLVRHLAWRGARQSTSAHKADDERADLDFAARWADELEQRVSVVETESFVMLRSPDQDESEGEPDVPT